MNETPIDLTDAVTPENPETTNTIKRYALIAVTAAAGVYVLVAGVKRFTDRKRVVLNVVDLPTSETPSV